MPPGGFGVTVPLTPKLFRGPLINCPWVGEVMA